VFVIFADLLIAAELDEKHELTLRKVLERAREKGVRFNRNKIQLREQVRSPFTNTRRRRSGH